MYACRYLHYERAVRRFLRAYRASGYEKVSPFQVVSAELDLMLKPYNQGLKQYEEAYG